MDLLQFAVFAFLFVCAMCPVLLHQLHMFQLNSYKPRVHLSRTLKTQPKRHLYAAAAVLCIPSALLIRSWGLWLSAGIMLITGLISLPKKAKKPLVFTKRIVRLVATLAVIIAIIAALPLLFPPTRPLFLCLMAVLPLLSPLLMLLANLINQPIERAINERFIKEAKSVIADFRRLTVIGVTGSYGKTSLKYFLGRLLSQKYNTLITPESYNTTLGVVRTIREKLRPVHEFFVCEMGARNVGDIKEICDIALPKHGVITSVGEQHLESFKTLDNILKTKFELADALPEDGILFVNMDSEPARERARHYKNVVGYGCDAAGDYTASDITVSGEGSQFKIEAPDGSATFFETRLIGRHNVLNITGAVAVAHTIGVPMDALVAGVRRLEPVQHRLQLIRSPRGIMIDDAYNSNPSGAKAALDVLSSFDGFKILVTPGMVELGDKQYESNFEFGRQAAETAELVVLIGSRQTKPIYDGLLACGFDINRIIVAEELMSGIQAAERFETGGRQRVFLLENDLPDNYK